MGEAVVTFERLVAAFPKITNKSKAFAQKVLPLPASPELAVLVAALMSDGHVEWHTSDFGRIKTSPVCRFISELKEVFGTDRKLAEEISKFTYKVYSSRQIEHFRRNESSVPLELVWVLMKIKKEKAILKELPEYVRFLSAFSSSAPLNP